MTYFGEESWKHSEAWFYLLNLLYSILFSNLVWFLRFFLISWDALNLNYECRLRQYYWKIFVLPWGQVTEFNPIFLCWCIVVWGHFVLVETEVQTLSSVAFTLALCWDPSLYWCVTGKKTIAFHSGCFTGRTCFCNSVESMCSWQRAHLRSHRDTDKGLVTMESSAEIEDRMQL